MAQPMNKYIIKDNKIHKFNDITWILEKKLNKRYIIYLDLNHWINLMHGNDPTSREILVLLNDLRRIKAIECATTLVQALEIGKSDNEISRNLLANFVDQITNGLSVRRHDQLLFFEFELITKSDGSLAGPKLTEPNNRSFAFTHLICNLGVPKLDFTPSCNVFSKQEVEMSEGIFDSILSSITYIISKTFNNRKASFEDYLNLSWARTRDRLIKEWGKGESFENALKQELEGGLDVLIKVIANNYKDNLPNSSFKNIDCINHKTIQMIPSLNTSCKLYAAFRSAGKNPQNTDAYDLMSASVVLPYVDIYATDKHIKYLATEILSLDKDYNTLVISKGRELLKILKDIVATSHNFE